MATFTMTVRVILQKAAREAMALNCNSLGTEHVLWVLLLDSRIQMLLSDLGVCPEKIQAAILSISTSDEERPFSFKSILQSPKVNEALRLGSDGEIDQSSAMEKHQGHLCIGLLLVTEDSVATTLKSRNITAEAIREYLTCHPYWLYSTDEVQKVKEEVKAELSRVQEQKEQVALRLETALRGAGEISRLRQEESAFEEEHLQLVEKEKAVNAHLTRVK